ncbi:hypothetical protein AB1L30_00010, partial [Bremerella sp. JC817]
MTAPHKPCLLVVDDEPEVCNSVYHLLRHRYHVLRAHGAAEAIDISDPGCFFSAPQNDPKNVV